MACLQRRGARVALLGLALLDRKFVVEHELDAGEVNDNNQHILRTSIT